MKRVTLLPGFLASDLAILATGEQIWFSTQVSALLGLGAMRLAANGISPGPPDGRQLGIIPVAKNPWLEVNALLQAQLGTADWFCQTLPWDWRLDMRAAVSQLAGEIRSGISPEEPITLVGHSAGGMLAILTYGDLKQTGDELKVRRIITIGTPFQGSYAPIQWLTGQLASVQELLAVDQAFGLVSGFNPFLWTQVFLNRLALTWPEFYALYPTLNGPDFATDPNRLLLYDSTLYGPVGPPSQAWLDWSRNVWQPATVDTSVFPPSWVMTTVSGIGIATADRLLSRRVPLDLSDLEVTAAGDGLVTLSSSTRTPAANVIVTGEHSSLPLGITQTGLLADLIRDPRGPLTPPPPLFRARLPIGQNVLAPPVADSVTGLQCIGGG